MKSMMFLLSFIVLSVYMIIVAIEDYKTCEVTRWKHLIGLMAALMCMILNLKRYPGIDYMMIFLTVAAFILAGCVGVYGLADGFALSNLTLFFGFLGGALGIGVVILIFIIASFSMLTSHVIRAVIKKEKIFKNRTAAFVPHLFCGYAVVMEIMIVL